MPSDPMKVDMTFHMLDGRFRKFTTKCGARERTVNWEDCQKCNETYHAGRCGEAEAVWNKLVEKYRNELSK